MSVLVNLALLVLNYTKCVCVCVERERIMSVYILRSYRRLVTHSTLVVQIYLLIISRANIVALEDDTVLEYDLIST